MTQDLSQGLSRGEVKLAHLARPFAPREAFFVVNRTRLDVLSEPQNFNRLLRFHSARLGRNRDLATLAILATSGQRKGCSL